MSIRTERVAEAIRRLASELLHTELRDPRIKGIVTITKVEVTPDLRLAKIYYRSMGDEKRLVTQGLQSAKRFIRRKIGDELKLRYTPEIILKYDKAVEYREHIDTILDKLHKEEKGKRGQSERRRKSSKSD